MNLTLPITIFGELKAYSSTISVARARILYKGANRNSTYISDEFANQLLSTLSYAPVKGIYDGDDFTDHGKARTEGRIYGVVPETHNLTWEDHEDDDGVTRTYACADVLLFTALYPEAAEIPGKGMSMELYAKSLKGEWKRIDGKRLYVYTDGCFLGLQALGDDVTPCFEGAEFFSLYHNLKTLVDTLEGGKRMKVINFKLSDGEKHDLIWTALNTNYNEEGDWEVQYSVQSIYDEYALCYDYESGSHLRVYYQKDDVNNTVTLGEFEKCFIVDVTETEMTALDLLKAANNGNFEKVDEVYSAANAQIETLTADLEEAQANIEATKDLAAEFEAKKEAYNLLETEVEALKNYKLEIETKAKQEVIDSYVELITEDALNEINEKIETYTLLDLKKELAYQATLKNPSIFTKIEDNDPGLIPSGGADNFSSATKILMKYKKNKE